MGGGSMDVTGQTLCTAMKQNPISKALQRLHVQEIQTALLLSILVSFIVCKVLVPMKIILPVRLIKQILFQSKEIMMARSMENKFMFYVFWANVGAWDRRDSAMNRLLA